jgi:hypothetical protein
VLCAVKDLLISAIGTGPWQIALVVALASSVAAIRVTTLYLRGDNERRHADDQRADRGAAYWWRPCFPRTARVPQLKPQPYAESAIQASAS